jgi:ribosomal protein L32
MQRILIIVAVLLIVWRVLVAVGRRLRDQSPSADSFSRFSPEARRRRRQWSDRHRAEVEELVECTECGTFVPAGRALGSGSSRVFCSPECRERSAARRDAEG